MLGHVIVLRLDCSDSEQRTRHGGGAEHCGGLDEFASAAIAEERRSELIVVSHIDVSSVGDRSNLTSLHRYD